MYPECPHYRPPTIAVDPETDKVYEGSAMCELTDKYCLVELDDECDIYNEFLEEVINE